MEQYGRAGRIPAGFIGGYIGDKTLLAVGLCRKPVAGSVLQQHILQVVRGHALVAQAKFAKALIVKHGLPAEQYLDLAVKIIVAIHKGIGIGYVGKAAGHVVEITVCRPQVLGLELVGVKQDNGVALHLPHHVVHKRLAPVQGVLLALDKLLIIGLIEEPEEQQAQQSYGQGHGAEIGEQYTKEDRTFLTGLFHASGISLLKQT